jgi:site-specific recombinase XerD
MVEAPKTGFDHMISKIKNRPAVAPAAPPSPLVVAWERFIREKQYIKNLSPKTIQDYDSAWRAWSRWLPEDPATITTRVVEDCVFGMRAAGLSAISTNSYLRVLKVFVRWLNVRNEDGDPLSVPMTQTPRLMPRTFSRDELAALLHSATRHHDRSTYLRADADVPRYRCAG